MHSPHLAAPSLAEARLSPSAGPPSPSLALVAYRIPIQNAGNDFQVDSESRARMYVLKICAWAIPAPTYFYA